MLDQIALLAAVTVLGVLEQGTVPGPSPFTAVVSLQRGGHQPVRDERLLLSWAVNDANCLGDARDEDGK